MAVPQPGKVDLSHCKFHCLRDISGSHRLPFVNILLKHAFLQRKPGPDFAEVSSYRMGRIGLHVSCAVAFSRSPRSYLNSSCPPLKGASPPPPLLCLGWSSFIGVLPFLGPQVV